MNRQPEAFETLLRFARNARVDADLVLECIQRRLIPVDGGRWNDGTYETICRVRRLMALGVNLQGIEVIFHMREQILSMQREMVEMEQQMQELREAHAQELARLARASDIGET